MSPAERLMAEGLAKGKAEGMAEGNAETSMRLLRRPFGSLPAALEQRQ